ncbi:MAG: hypothetical protein Q9220_006248 [cf. Caloplaca sp. 1 TL-2023]
MITTQEYPVSSGNYLIRYCGTGPGSKAAQLQTLLPQFWEQLQLVISDVQRGVASKAFRAFFKTDESIEYVKTVFQNMADGAPVQVPVKGAPTHFTQPTRPLIMCPDPILPIYEDFMEFCEQESRPLAGIFPNRELVALCPLFWDIDDVPVYGDCPYVRRNSFIPNDHEIVINRFGAFVHEFAHAYLRNWADDELYKPNEAVAMTTQRSFRSSQNYAFYASMVVAGCRKYVNPELLHDSERIILEIAQGQTSDVAALSSSIAAVEAAESIGSFLGSNIEVTPLPLLGDDDSEDDILTGLESFLLPTATGGSVSSSTSSPTTTTPPGKQAKLRRTIGKVGPRATTAPRPTTSS